jgi:hypothetical protein
MVLAMPGMQYLTGMPFKGWGARRVHMSSRMRLSRILSISTYVALQPEEIRICMCIPMRLLNGRS